LGGENEPIFKKECSSCKTNIMKLWYDDVVKFLYFKCKMLTI
jgi:hypothetical protein